MRRAHKRRWSLEYPLVIYGRGEDARSVFVVDARRKSWRGLRPSSLASDWGCSGLATNDDYKEVR